MLTDGATRRLGFSGLQIHSSILGNFFVSFWCCLPFFVLFRLPQHDSKLKTIQRYHYCVIGHFVSFVVILLLFSLFCTFSLFPTLCSVVFNVDFPGLGSLRDIVGYPMISVIKVHPLSFDAAEIDFWA